jgi:hypothetical protein
VAWLARLRYASLMKPLAALLLLLSSTFAAAEELPTRKPGLWELETSMVGPGGRHAMKHCTDAETDAAMTQMGKATAGPAGAACTKNELRREGDSYVAEADCTVGESRIVTHSVFSGDFNSNYSGETTTTYDPPMMGVSETKMKLSARWVGPCEPGQEPGDVIMPNGMKMNMKSMIAAPGSTKP